MSDVCSYPFSIDSCGTMSDRQGSSPARLVQLQTSFDQPDGIGGSGSTKTCKNKKCEEFIKTKATVCVNMKLRTSCKIIYFLIPFLSSFKEVRLVNFIYNLL